ncbi:STAS domain-containing protein [Brevibacillus ginsengisoli]|uniref:STAS domain-containing protein n=1 Tax=Brevibacillus ginsengisoli TaxID=363854 RepID=UPI003CE8F456
MSVQSINNPLEKPSIIVRTQKVRDYQKVVFIGKLVYGQTESAKKQAYELLEDASGYIFDIRQLDSIDSTGFGVLINIGKKINQLNRSMAIIVENGWIKELLHIAKFQLIFPIAHAEEEALAFLQKNHQPLLRFDEY